ncbi:MAG: response regulator [Candidatus Theseobacter exili]|nr:response regulator [Candidatus Theseobacter exili]
MTNPKGYNYDIKRGADIYRRISFSRFKKWICSGKLKRGEIVVWRSSLSGWRKAEDLEELAPFFKEWEKLQRIQPDDETKGSEERPKKKKIKNILIVDDEEDLCTLLSEALKQKKYNVEIAGTRKEAMDIVKKKNLDLVFLDMNLPDGNGLMLISKIKKINPDTVINIISAYSNGGNKEKATKKGANEFIEKPFTDKDILKSIKRITG